jgi:hypothetical protein
MQDCQDQHLKEDNKSLTEESQGTRPGAQKGKVLLAQSLLRPTPGHRAASACNNDIKHVK